MKFSVKMAIAQAKRQISMRMDVHPRRNREHDPITCQGTAPMPSS